MGGVIEASLKSLFIGTDELGSKGFNQIQNMYSYGSRSSQGDHRDGARCHWVSSYSRAGKSIVNHYDPAQNILAKAAFLAGGSTSGGGDCGRSFYKGFKQKLFTAKHDLPNTKLIKTITGSKNFVVAGDYKDDTYEVLIKALGAYNQGSGTFNTSKSWSELIITPASELKPTVVTAMEYGYDILHGKSRGIELPDRIYIWEGGKGVDLNKDGRIGDNPATPDVIEGDGEKEAPWCFKFGEKEWVDGKLFKSIRDAAIGSLDNPAKGRVNCTTGILL